MDRHARLSPLKRQLPELLELEQLLRQGAPYLEVSVEAALSYQNVTLPIYAIRLGTSRPDAPAIGFFGGVHGIERIGTQVLLALLHHLIQRLSWDDNLHACLQRVCLIFMPLINPIGMWRQTRCNGNGVDLMRNAPIVAEGKASLLVGGQRLSRRLPWYRGTPGSSLEPEAQALCRTVQRHLLGRPFSLTLDCHSGFGMRDRIWFPYAYSRQPFAELAEVFALKQLFERTYPHHNYYLFEPQSRHYTTHGDLWDYLYLQSRSRPGCFLPLTLELGSWRWVKKNPLQIFRLLGLFNPIKPHRHHRILRRHQILLNFLIHSTQAHSVWLPQAERQQWTQQAYQLWYPHRLANPHDEC